MNYTLKDVHNTINDCDVSPAAKDAAIRIVATLVEIDAFKLGCQMGKLLQTWPNFTEACEIAAKIDTMILRKHNEAQKEIS